VWILREEQGTEVTDEEFSEPHVEVARDRFGRYLLPDPKTGATTPWTRVTTLARTLSDEFALNQWRIREVVKGIGLRPDLAALASATHADDKQTLQGIGDDAQAVAGSDKGANLGRALHTFSQRLDGGAPNVPAQYMPHMIAYQDALKAAGFAVVPALMERIIVCPEIPVAGQFDRLLQPVGASRLVVGDLKTAKLESITYAWLEIAIQLSVYAHATMMWDHATKRYHAMPSTDLARAIVMHLPQDLPPDQIRCDIYEIDIVKGWEAALVARDVRALRKVSKGWARPLAEKVEEVRTPAAQVVQDLRQVYRDLKESHQVFRDLQESRERVGDHPLVPPAPPAPLERVRAATSREQLSALWRELSAAGQWTPELAAAGKARLGEL
jgi:hypothetical protein